jgi:hypothetical protein
MTTTTAPARDGRCFVETPAEVADAARSWLAATAEWKAQPKGQLDSRLYLAAMDAQRELVRVMEEAQAPHARLAGYYSIDGVWFGFDRIHSDGLQLTIKRSKPVFASKRAR